MPWLILAICLLVGGVLILRWFLSTPPPDILRVLRWTALVLLVVGFLAIALSGRWNLLWMIAPLIVPLLLRWRPLRSIRRNARGPSPGRSSEVETRYLRMTLDHDSGDMDGEVREGRFRDRTLSSLSLEEIVELWREYALRDEQSRTVLESYMDRTYSDWREAAGDDASRSGRQDKGGSESSWAHDDMSVREARDILGVDELATDSEIEAAWRREMKRAHPDHGGSDQMAAKINQAKEVLLKR